MKKWLNNADILWNLSFYCWLGFVFSTLKDQYPEKLEKLAELKQHLLDSNNDMAPMKVEFDKSKKNFIT